MYSGRAKLQVRKLRSEGKTYSEIIKLIRTEIPKSTISEWCKNVVMPSWYQDKIDHLNQESLSKAQKKALVSNQIKRDKLLDELKANNRHIADNIKNKDILKMLLAFLYLGEGTKWKSHRGLTLGSSDPEIIKLYIRLLYLCYNIKIEQLKCRISYRADQNINSLQRYWSHVTAISIANFYKTIPDPRTVGKPTKNKNYKGVCVVSCGGTHIQIELELIPKLILEVL